MFRADLVDLGEGTPQMIELKQEIVRLSKELQTAKQKSFQDLQTLATTMTARNTEFAADLQKLQAEQGGSASSGPSTSSGGTTLEPPADHKAAVSRGRSTSFAQKVKGLFTSSKKSNKDQDD